MKQLLSILFIVGIFASYSFSKPKEIITKSSDDDSLHFEGKINDKYAFAMSLLIKGNAVTGQYYYLSKQLPIKLKGKIEDGKDLELSEYSGNVITGHFRGTLSDRNHFEGFWSKKEDDVKGSKWFAAFCPGYLDKMNQTIREIENKDAQKIEVLSIDTSDNIIVNGAFLSKASEPVRAILAYYSKIAGTDCEYDGTPDDKMDNISCKLTKALQLGYQCSYQQKAIISKWFRADSVISKDPDNCYATPRGASTEMKLEISGNKVVVYDLLESVDMPDEDFANYKEIAVFSIGTNSVTRMYYSTTINN